MSWDDSGASVPRDSDQTCRGGYRELPKPRSFRGTADSLRMLQYHEFGDISKPTCVSPFFRAAPSSYDFALGYQPGCIHPYENEDEARWRRLGNRGARETTKEA